MAQVVDAVYEHGAFRPLVPPDPVIAEGQQVRIVIDTTRADDMLALATQVYAGLSEEDIDEIERIALDRSAFFTDRDR